MALKNRSSAAELLKGSGTKLKEFLLEAGLLPKEWMSEVEPSQFKYPAAQDFEELANTVLPNSTEMLPGLGAVYFIDHPGKFNSPRLKKIRETILDNVPTFTGDPELKPQFKINTGPLKKGHSIEPKIVEVLTKYMEDHPAANALMELGYDPKPEHMGSYRLGSNASNAPSEPLTGININWKNIIENVPADRADVLRSNVDHEFRHLGQELKGTLTEDTLQADKPWVDRTHEIDATLGEINDQVRMAKKGKPINKTVYNTLKKRTDNMRFENANNPEKFLKIVAELIGRELE
jgi:hypothetical protein